MVVGDITILGDGKNTKSTAADLRGCEVLKRVGVGLSYDVLVVSGSSLDDIDWGLRLAVLV